MSRFVRVVPSVALQIIFGIIFGSAIFHINPNATVITTFSNIGLFAIFFQVGLDFDLSAPELTSTTPARSAVAGVATSFVLVFLASLAIGHPLRSSLLVGLATVSTSVSVAIYSFLSLGPLVHLEAKVAVVAGLFDDLLGLTVLAVLASVLSHSLGGVISLAVSLVVVAISYMIQRRLSGRSYDLVKFRRYGLVALLILVMVFLWHRFGLTLAIAGFVAGAFSGPVLSKGDQRVLSAVGGRLGPLFMVSLGLLVNVRSGLSLTELVGVVVFSVALIVSKGATALVMGDQLKDKILYWFSMVPRAEVAGIGMVLIAPDVSSSLEFEAILAVVVTSVLTPVVIQRRVKRSNRTGES